MKIIAIANQKGGVGKTTTAAALGSGLQIKGFNVLYIDLDAQCNLSYTLGADTSGITMYEVLTEKATAAEAVQQTPQGAILAASPMLATADINITGRRANGLLKQALRAIKQDYDYILIDSPPALGILTVNAFTAADYVIIPAQADIYSLQGIGQLYNTITAVRRQTNPRLRISGILITRYSGRAVLTRQISAKLEDTATRLHTKVYDTRIREGIAVKEAQTQGISLFDYAPKSNPARDYTAFITELLKDIERS